MIPVSSLDAGMLYAETPEMPMHTMGVLVLEPPLENASVTPFEVLRYTFEKRIHLIPPLRHRLVQGPLQIGDPHWIEDPEFDLDRHLLRASLPPPGGLSELRDFVGEFAAGLLDRQKPLWEITLVEGLAGGEIAIVSKIHHAAMDGGRLVALIGHLFDHTSEWKSIPPPEEPWTPEKLPTTRWLAADTLRTLMGKPRRAAAAAVKVASALRHREPRHDGDERPKGHPPPSTPFNRALTPNRSVGLSDVALSDLKDIKRAFGTTINDVVLAASCASLRSWLSGHGGLPEHPLVVSVPVALPAEGDEEVGNRVSMIRVHLPVQTEDSVARLLAISEETAQGKKAVGRGGGAGVFKHFTDIVTNITVPWILTHAMSLYAASHLADRLPPLWNLVISNVPGSPDPLYSAGTRLLRAYPLGPVQQGSGLNITVMSTSDRLCVGVMACKELVPDVQDIATGFVHEIETLKALAAR